MDHSIILYVGIIKKNCTIYYNIEYLIPNITKSYLHLLRSKIKNKCLKLAVNVFKI